jgi:hypothetical protein
MNTFFVIFVSWVFFFFCLGLGLVLVKWLDSPLQPHPVLSSPEKWRWSGKMWPLHHHPVTPHLTIMSLPWHVTHASSLDPYHISMQRIGTRSCPTTTDPATALGLGPRGPPLSLKSHHCHALRWVVVPLSLFLRKVKLKGWPAPFPSLRGAVFYCFLSWGSSSQGVH